MIPTYLIAAEADGLRARRSRMKMHAVQPPRQRNGPMQPLPTSREDFYPCARKVIIVSGMLPSSVYDRSI